MPHFVFRKKGMFGETRTFVASDGESAVPSAFAVQQMFALITRSLVIPKRDRIVTKAPVMRL